MRIEVGDQFILFNGDHVEILSINDNPGNDFPYCGAINGGEDMGDWNSHGIYYDEDAQGMMDIRESV